MDDFTNLSSNKDNPLNFNINSYMNKQICSYNPNDFNNYIKINNNFFTYFNIIPFKKNDYPCLFKGVSIFIHIMLLMISISPEKLYDDEDDEYHHHSNVDDNLPITLFGIIMSYWPTLAFVLCFCKFNECCEVKCLRIDIIITSDLDKIFIGASYNDETKYIKTCDFELNNVERFFLENRDEGFNLKAILKGNITNEILFIEVAKTRLDGLIYILNEKIVNNNKEHQQQYFSEYPLTTTPS